MEIQNRERDRFRGALLGLACGDALGVARQSADPGSFEPVTTMLGGGPQGLKPGEWTEDTSLALCLAHSLVVCQGFDPADQMERYQSWLQTGYQSCFGIPGHPSSTVVQALQRYKSTRYAYAGSTACCTAGNAPIARVAPVAMYYSAHLGSAVHYSGESSRTTHGNSKCIDACRLLGLYIYRTLNGASKNSVLAPPNEGTLSNVAVDDISLGIYRDKPAEMIRSTGYVADSLEAALWCFWKTNSFSEAVLMAANLGDDTSTTAAVCGQLAGAYYGESGIPPHWVDMLAWSQDIRLLGEELYTSAHHRDEEVHSAEIIPLKGIQTPNQA